MNGGWGTIKEALEMNVDSYLRYASRFTLALCCTLLLVACGVVSELPDEAEDALLSDQALPNNAAACFYEHINYQGASFCGSANTASLNTQWNNRISSVKVQPGYQVRLFNNANYGGSSLTLSANVGNLVNRNFNDDASSLKISKTSGGGTGELDKKCTPSVKITYEDKNAARTQPIKDLYPETLMQLAAVDVCRTLYKNASEVRTISNIELLVRYAPDEVAWTSGGGNQATIMISTAHITKFKNEGGNVYEEIKGILYHEVTHVYQQDDSDGGGADGGLIEGIADYVRFKSGFIPADATPDKSGNWNDGYRTTAFFLLWMSKQYPDSVYKLNLSLSSSDGKKWTPQAFKTITSKTVDQLWQAYRTSP
jgi:hypothetical protein